MAYADTPFVKILTGIRRCGKSTILKMLIAEMKERGIRDAQILHYSFDSLEYENIKTAKALFAHLKQHLFLKGKTYLFLDEIQGVTSWEKVVNSLMADYDADIYVTGSNSRMMSSEISTYLTGRYITFRIYPLSFSEYMTFRKESTEVLSSSASRHESTMPAVIRSACIVLFYSVIFRRTRRLPLPIPSLPQTGSMV